MDFLPSSFAGRLILLLVLMICAALIEFAIKGKQAQRWKEYVFLLLCASVTALIGLVHDYFTVQISPLYFILGKSLPDDPRLVYFVMELGAQAGSVMGFIIGGLLLVCLKEKWPYRQLWLYICSIIVVALVIEQIFRLLEPLLGLHYPLLNEIGIPEEDQAPFYTVWAMHIGIYTGALLSFIAVWFYDWKKRKAETD